jgi:hypothetical protein
MAGSQEHRASPRIDCYSRFGEDENVDHGLVIDISETGAGLTLSKDASLFKDADSNQSADSYGCLRLNIFHPDYACEEGLNLNANIAWLDHEYSKDRLKLGVLFSEMDERKSGHINEFIDWIQKKENYFLRASLEKC